MVILTEAKVVCEYCGRFIRDEKVYFGTSQTPVTTTFDLCLDCQNRFVPYNTLANTNAIAYCLSKENIPDQIMMRDFAQRSHEFVNLVKAQRIDDPRDIFKQHELELERLSNQANQVLDTYKSKYQRICPLPKWVGFVESAETPFIQYREYIHRKYKKLYHP